MPERAGYVSVWLCRLADEAAFSSYTEDWWDEDGVRHMSEFAREFGIDWYDPDLREFDVCPDAVHELLQGVSRGSSFVPDVIRALGSTHVPTYRSFMLLFDYAHEGPQQTVGSVFIGVFPYHASAPPYELRDTVHRGGAAQQGDEPDEA